MAQKNDLKTLVLRLADDQIVAGHRLSEWSGKAPSLEDDLALSNIALDLLGQAENLYQYAAKLLDDGRSADDLAFLRSEREYSNLIILELANGDFANTILKHLYYSTFMYKLWGEMQKCNDEILLGIAVKAVKECQYHVKYCAEWTIRLGNGTNESSKRLNKANENLETYIGEMFFEDKVNEKLKNIMPKISEVKEKWKKEIKQINKIANIKMPKIKINKNNGRNGKHTDDLSGLLGEMQYMQRTYPNAQW